MSRLRLRSKSLVRLYQVPQRLYGLALLRPVPQHLYGLALLRPVPHQIRMNGEQKL